MGFKVFIVTSYFGNPIAFDLRNTFNRYGITSIIDTEILSPAGKYEELIKSEIQQCDCLLAIIEIGGLRGQSIDYELGLASALNKIVLPFIEQGSNIPPSIARKPFIVFDRANPRLSYEHVAQYLSKLKVEKESKNSLGALLLLGLGIILLGALASSDK